MEKRELGDLKAVADQLRRLADALETLGREPPSRQEEKSTAVLAATAPEEVRDLVSCAVDELARRAKGGGAQVLIVGVHRRSGGPSTAWYDWFSDEDVLKVLGNPGLIRALELMTSIERLRLLFTLASGISGSAEAMGQSGLSQGQFYHHLRLLEAAGMVRKVARDRYEPTVHGTSILYSILAVADHIASKIPAIEEEPS